MATRSFLHSLTKRLPKLPFLILVDFDPDGLQIYHCYKHGTGNVLDDMTVSNASMRLVGIKACHFMSESVLRSTLVHREPAAVDTSDVAREKWWDSSIGSSTTANKLSLRDRNMISSMLHRIATKVDASLTTGIIRRELQIMQLLGYKAEIQLLDDHGDLRAWLNSEIEADMMTTV